VIVPNASMTGVAPFAISLRGSGSKRVIALIRLRVTFETIRSTSLPKKYDFLEHSASCHAKWHEMNGWRLKGMPMSPFPAVLSGNTLTMGRESRGLASRRRREHSLGYAGIAALGIDGEGKCRSYRLAKYAAESQGRSADKRIEIEASGAIHDESP
jgi:hypothetical protein